jgi:hypothetical protein
MSKLKFTQKYKICHDGTIFSLSSNWRGYGERELVQDLNSHGYPSVRIYINGKRKRICVHRLVAMEYLPPKPSPMHQIRHLDGDKKNNYYKNLKWGTARQNALDREKHRKQKATGMTIDEVLK